MHGERGSRLVVLTSGCSLAPFSSITDLPSFVPMSRSPYLAGLLGTCFSAVGERTSSCGRSLRTRTRSRKIVFCLFQKCWGLSWGPRARLWRRVNALNHQQYSLAKQLYFLSCLRSALFFCLHPPCHPSSSPSCFTFSSVSSSYSSSSSPVPSPSPSYSSSPLPLSLPLLLLLLVLLLLLLFRAYLPVCLLPFVSGV